MKRFSHLLFWNICEKNKVNYLSKQVSSIYNSAFSLMVHAMDFGLRIPCIFLTCFLKMTLYISQYSLFESCIIWIVCSLSVTLRNKSLFYVLTIYLLLRFVNRKRAFFKVADLWQARHSNKDLWFYFPFKYAKYLIKTLPK